MSIGQSISRLRRLGDLSQTALAEMIGKSNSTVNHYEKGVNAPPLKVLEVMAVAFTKAIGQTIRPEDIVSNGTTQQAVASGMLAAIESKLDELLKGLSGG